MRGLIQQKPDQQNRDQQKQALQKRDRKSRDQQKILAAMGLLCFATSVSAFPWSKDMADQKTVKAQETIVRMPPGAISRNGRAPTLPVAPLNEARKLAGASLQSPWPPVFSSISQGQVLYQRHCSSCHGIDGKHPGIVGDKLQPKPMDLTLDYVRQQPDGQVYYTISQGSTIMPAYWYTMTPADRWALVNYVRHGLGK